MEINQVLDMLSLAYDYGYTGGDRREAVLAILDHYKITKDYVATAKEEEESRIYTVEELKKMPVGTRFLHSLLGTCSIAQLQNGKKYMMFDGPGIALGGFNVDDYPWDHPLKKLDE